VKPYLLVLFFLLLLVTGAFAASAQPAQLVALACFGNTQFQNCPSGGRPDNVIQASDGNFYGVSEVTQEGESNPQGGSVFKVTPSGQFTLLHTFPAVPNNNYPSGNLPGFLAEGSDGNLYGTTLYGGSHSGGVLFRISKMGTGLKIVHQFCSAANCADGQNQSGLSPFRMAICTGQLRLVVPSVAAALVDAVRFSSTTSPPARIRLYIPSTTSPMEHFPLDSFKPRMETSTVSSPEPFTRSRRRVSTPWS
jgi:uncharacterized repeat protein (TIGR03803 family)